jgi:RNA ligase
MSWIIASRNSFISEQSIEANKMIDPLAYELLDIRYTYLFEIIYKKNKIIVDYGDKYSLILLAAIKTINGDELSYIELNNYSNYFEIVTKRQIKILNCFNDLKNYEEINKEGFVIKFSNNLRCVVKFDEYLKLYSLLGDISNIVVWEYLKNNTNFNDLYYMIPDTYHEWLKNTIKDLQDKFNEIERLSLKEFIRIYHINNIVDRGRFAEES